MTVREFIQLTPFQKVRLQEADPAEYNRLKQLADEQFNPNSDPEAARELLKG